ncbi:MULTISPECIES: phage tail tape measure protein [Glaesserella]|uniref:Phage tail tape measure protein n=1 Tax=Glaesserella australis TaxID=2094024 RepID=A0A328C3J2_9PAST|nr:MULTISPECIES: phage tail tape measure protein [Glaesserella]AUI65629.1 phage tail tape measure protein [Glaesserella sp. 15-184]RAL19084.1 phage tail tape measure protein [Glaesserella australis]
MSSLGGLNIILNLETIQFQNGLSKSDQETKKFVKQFEANFSSAQKKVREFSERTTQYLNNIENAAHNINKTSSWNFKIDNFERIKSLAANFVEIADKSTELSNKLKLVTENEVQHAKAMADVYDISLKTAQSTQAVSAIYSSFSQNAKELRINQQQVASITETISKAVAISGASTSEAQNSLTQFSQTLLMGKMRSQEYNSIMTQTPAVLQAIARGLGITMGELKKMSDDGKLTTDKIIQGLEKSKTSVDELYSKTTTTVSGAMQNLQTATQKWVGELDTSLGVSDKAVKVTELLARHLDDLAKTAVVVGVAYGSWKLSSVIQGQYNSIKATQAETTAKYEKLAALTQETQATYQTQLATYQSIQSKQADVVATQAQIQAEQAKLRILSLSATSYAERKAIQVELQALDRISAELTQKQTFLDQQQAAAKKALSLAYRENAFAQSAFAASTKASGIAMTAFSAITAGVKAEMNALKVAMLSNPIMMGLTILTTASSLLYMFSSSTNDATEASLRYADSIEQVRGNLERMTAAQTFAELIKVKRSIEAQQESVANLKAEQDKLIQQIETGINRSMDEMTGILFESILSAKELAEKKEKLIIVTADLENEQNKLNRTLEWQRDLKAHIPIAELRDRFAELFPNIEQSQIKVDGLNVSVGNFTFAIPSATTEALSFAGAIGTVAATALQAAVAVANFQQVSTGISADAQKIIDRNSKQLKIQQLEKSGNFAEAAKLKAELQIDSDKFQGADFDALMKSYTEGFLYQYNNKPKGGGKPKKPKKTEAEKAAEKVRKQAEKSREDYQKQFGEMSYRLSELKANTKDIEMFGQVSQYQEVKKLTEDITLNAEKYAGYGSEGIAKLKVLASQIDSENQKIAIAKLKFESNESLDAMKLGIDLLGKTRTEQELIQFNHQLDLEVTKLRQDMSKENIAILDQEIAKIKERHANLQAEAETARSSWKLGMQQGWNTIQDDITNVAENTKNITVNAFGQMSDAMTELVTTGKADFRSMTQSILKDISNMIIKMLIFRAISSAFGGWAGGTTTVNANAVHGMGTWATGGYTGDGGKFTPAGIVHKGEYVITKEATSRIGLDYLNYLNYGKRGFASGGGVAVPRVPSINHQPSAC